MHAQRLPHQTEVKRILRYLQHTPHLGLQLSKSQPMNITAFSNADQAGCPDDRKSTNAYCIFSGYNLISWSSKKQATIVRSSIEIEFKSVANATAEVIWVQNLCKDLAIDLTMAPTLYCNNLGATYLSSNPIFHARTKQVEIDFHFVRNWVLNKSLTMTFISSKDQLADVLTKPLSAGIFQLICSNLRLRSLQLDLRGPIQLLSTLHACHADHKAWPPPRNSIAAAVNISYVLHANHAVHSAQPLCSTTTVSTATTTQQHYTTIPKGISACSMPSTKHPL